MFRIMPIKKMPGPLKSLSFALTLFAFLIGGQESRGQEIQNLSVKLENHDIIITFDLKSAAHPQELFDVFIYGSHDNYSKAIEVKEGKTKDIFPGLGKRFVIDAQKTFMGFKGDLDFRIDAHLTFIPLSMVSPTTSIKTKVGKSVFLQWSGGDSESTFKLDYSKEGGDWTTISDNVQSRTYNWQVPKKMPKGTYSVKVSSDQDRSKAIYSGNIVIKKKTSPFVFIIPMAAAGAAWYFLLGPGAGGEDTDPSPSLPGPPGPPTTTGF